MIEDPLILKCNRCGAKMQTHHGAVLVEHWTCQACDAEALKPIIGDHVADPALADARRRSRARFEATEAAFHASERRLTALAKALANLDQEEETLLAFSVGATHEAVQAALNKRVGGGARQRHRTSVEPLNDWWLAQDGLSDAVWEKEGDASPRVRFVSHCLSSMDHSVARGLSNFQSVKRLLAADEPAK